jgi:transposase-like protein
LGVDRQNYAASHCAVADLKGDGELPKRVVVRRSKYLNNLIEQDHRRIKQRLRPTLGLKSFETANTVIRGIELAEKTKKQQLKMGKLGGRRCGRLRWSPEQYRDRHSDRDRIVAAPKLHQNRKLFICL